VQWQISTNGGSVFTAISNATADTLTVADVTANDNGLEYRAVFTNSLGSAATNVATLTVPEVPPPGTLACVLAPGVLNEAGNVSYAISGTAPAQVLPGGSLSLAGSTLTMTLPATWATSFSGLEANEVSGVVEHLPIDAIGATPATLDAAQVPPFGSLNVLEIGPGLPISAAAVTSGTSIPISAPVMTSSVIDSSVTPPETYDQPGSTPGSVDIGPFTATGATGSDVTLSLDATPGFTQTGNAYSVTGHGISLELEGFSGGTDTPATLQFGPVLVACNGPTGPALATVPINAAPASTAPVVAGVAPTSGTPFTLVMVRGKNLRGARSVQFGAHRAFFLTLSNTLILALAPPQASGTVDVTVTTPKGTSATSSADEFTYG